MHKALTSVLWMYCKCSKERWKRTEMRHSFLLAARQESEWNTHKHIFLSNNTPLIAVHFQYHCFHISSEPYRSSHEPYPRPPFLSGLGYGSRVFTRGRKTAFTSSKRTELWRQSNPVFCQFVPCQTFLPPIKTVGSTIQQWKMLPAKLWFINVYTYHNPKPTLTVIQIH